MTFVDPKTFSDDDLSPSETVLYKEGEKMGIIETALELRQSVPPATVVPGNTYDTILYFDRLESFLVYCGRKKIRLWYVDWLHETSCS